MLLSGRGQQPPSPCRIPSEEGEALGFPGVIPILGSTTELTSSNAERYWIAAAETDFVSPNSCPTHGHNMVRCWPSATELLRDSQIQSSELDLLWHLTVPKRRGKADCSSKVLKFHTTSPFLHKERWRRKKSSLPDLLFLG